MDFIKSNKKLIQSLNNENDPISLTAGKIHIVWKFTKTNLEIKEDGRIKGKFISRIDIIKRLIR